MDEGKKTVTHPVFSEMSSVWVAATLWGNKLLPRFAKDLAFLVGFPLHQTRLAGKSPNSTEVPGGLVPLGNHRTKWRVVIVSLFMFGPLLCSITRGYIRTSH
jgi:hypothetical protein